MNVYALQTVRKESKSVPNKNLIEIDGKPLWKHNWTAAALTPIIDGIFITTDVEEILNADFEVINKELVLPKTTVIKRPKHLCEDNTPYYEVLKHGVKTIEKITKSTCDILIILLGNSKGARSGWLHIAAKELKYNSTLDSVMSVSRYNMFNPLRAFQIEYRRLKSVGFHQLLPKKPKDPANKDAIGDIFFFNGGFFATKRAPFLKGEGFPYEWMGKNILPIVQDGSDMEIDAEWQISVLRDKEKKK